MNQPGLFDSILPGQFPARTILAPEMELPGQARVEDPETAKTAAAETDARAIEGIVLRAIEQADLGLTSEECAAQTGLSLVTVSPRMRPLCRREKIRDSGTRRKNKSGKSAIVWVSNKSIVPRPTAEADDALGVPDSWRKDHHD